jgi:predicted nucleic acid-binding protein
MPGTADFLDSNVFIYTIDVDAPSDKRRVAVDLVQRALVDRTAVISWQVVQETLHVAAHKFKSVVSNADRQDLLQHVLQPLWTVQPDAALYAEALRLQARAGFAFYDSLIVAAALHAGCRRLLTEDLQHGQLIGKLRIENPFRA